MKRFSLAVILFASVIALGITETVYLKKLNRKLTEHVSLTEEYFPDNRTAAEGEAETAIELWEDNKILLSVFINHDKLDDISEGLITLKYRCLSSEDDFRLAVSDVKHLLRDMIKEERFSVYSFL